MDGGESWGINWSGDVYLEDLLDRKIDKKLKFSDFVTNSTSNILRLRVNKLPTKTMLHHVLIHEMVENYLILPFLFLHLFC